MEEEGLIFRRHKEWLESLMGSGFSSSSNTATLSLADEKLVMGIKGRRVHMIEEMSDTIISFQKVNSTARDRIVQISGQTKDNINVAKNLIDATIKQNISPIPFNEFADSGENNYPPAEELYTSNEYIANPAKYSSQSSANSLSEIDNSGHNIKLSVQNKEASINISDKLIGEQLEKFLNKYNFMDFIKRGLSEEKPPRSNGAAICEDRKQYYTYERDFLLKFKDFNSKDSSRVIEDIKQKQNHLYRY